VVGREMDGRLALALELLDTALRADWERHTLPLGQAPLPLREVLWALVRYVVAHADAGRRRPLGLRSPC
jgi:hypothetical protein